MWRKVFRCAATTTRRLNRSTLWKSVRFFTLSGAHNELKFFFWVTTTLLYLYVYVYEWENEKENEKHVEVFLSSARSLTATPTANVMMHDVENTALPSTTTLIFSLCWSFFRQTRAKLLCLVFFFSFQLWNLTQFFRFIFSHTEHCCRWHLIFSFCLSLSNFMPLHSHSLLTTSPPHT